MKTENYKGNSYLVPKWRGEGVVLEIISLVYEEPVLYDSAAGLPAGRSLPRHIQGGVVYWHNQRSRHGERG